MCACIHIDHTAAAVWESGTRVFDGSFSLVGPDQQGAVMLEAKDNCTLIIKWPAPHLWAKITNNHPTGCAATMATKHHKQGSSPCLYVRGRQETASHQHTDCKGPMSQKMTRLLTKLEPWTAVSALLGLINKVQSYDKAWGTLFIYNQMDVCVCVCLCTCACVCAHHSWSITRQSYLIQFERENLTNFSALVPLSSIGKFPKLELIEIF